MTNNTVHYIIYKLVAHTHWLKEKKEKKKIDKITKRV